MATMNTEKVSPSRELPLWVLGLLPLAVLGLILLLFSAVNPLALFTADLPPIENLVFEPVRVTETGFEVTVVNDSPDPVSIAQVLVDDAFWQYTVEPGNTIPRLGKATLTVAYPWVEAEPHEIVLLTETGATFSTAVELATLTPTPGVREFLAYGLLGFYVGIVPVALGMLWYPFLKRLGRKWLGLILALTLGLLVFLLIDTVLEALEVSETLPGAFQGIPLIIFAALLTWLALLAIGSRRRKRGERSPLGSRIYLAGMIALGIGLHNLGEGLAIGASFSLGEVALGTFLVIGFTLHNITEGVGIVAPLIPRKSAAGKSEQPSLLTFAWLALMAGAPAIFGTWIGGFAFSPLLATIFLGIGTGAIWQVIVEVGGLLQRYAREDETPVASWANLTGFLIGIGIMYLTAILVKF